MPRVVVPAFSDPSNTADSLAQSNSRVINFYLETSAPGTSRATVYSKRTPGVHPSVTWPDYPIRGMYEINDRCFVVGGGTFGELTSSGLGPPFAVGATCPIANDNQPVSMCSNGSAGHQVFVVSANLGYIFDLTANTFTQITDPYFPNPCRQGEFIGGYFLALHGEGSRQMSYSALEDGTTWSTTTGGATTGNLFERSYAADNVSTIIRNHTELWVLGFRTSEVWVMNQGSGENAWVPQTGVFIEQGGQAVWSPQRCDNTIVWLSQNDDGQGIVFRANGYTPQRVSTHAVELDLQRANTPTDARAFVLQSRGHTFYCLQLPRDLETTWVYDVTTDRWHEWAIWDPTSAQWFPHIANCHVFVFNTHFVGSRLDGTIYELSEDFWDDQITGSLV